MQKQQPSTLFAFKLAGKQDQDSKPAQQWKVREGVSVAGCTNVPGKGDIWYRFGNQWSEDGGVYC